jgi:hypothetical protein
LKWIVFVRIPELGFVSPVNPFVRSLDLSSFLKVAFSLPPIASVQNIPVRRRLLLHSRLLALSTMTL